MVRGGRDHKIMCLRRKQLEEDMIPTIKKYQKAAICWWIRAASSVYIATLRDGTEE